MSSLRARWLLAALPALLATVLPVSAADDDGPSLRAMKDEAARAASLALPDAPRPYFVSFRVVEHRSLHATASFGALTGSDDGHRRLGYVDVRVGSRQLDGSTAREGWRDWDVLAEAMSCDESYDAIRRDLWTLADRAYEKAASKLARVQAAMQTQASHDPRLPEFSEEPVTRTVSARAGAWPALADVEALARDLSRAGRQLPALQGCQVFAYAGRERMQFASTEGSTADDTRSEAWVDVELSATALDGMALARRVSFVAADWSRLRAADTMASEVRAAAAEFVALREAPLLESYSGPILFEGRAAPQLVA